MFVLIFTVVAVSLSARAQEEMTAERFREIVSSPGDNTPLNPKLLAIGPIWTNATITVDLKYADGRKMKEEISGSNKTVKGKYVVATVNSDLYKQPINSIQEKQSQSVRRAKAKHPQASQHIKKSKMVHHLWGGRSL